MDILDVAVALGDRIRHITTRHEQGAAFMADVYGRLTGRAAVAMATLGPGATNLLTGIADAYLDRAPMVAITGQAVLGQAPQGGPPGRRHRPTCSSRSRSGTPASSGRRSIPEIVRKAFRVATLEKPGPTHIELPENIAATRSSPRTTDPAARPRPGLLPRADRRRDRPRRAAASPRPSGRSSWPATASCAGARRASCARSPAACTCRSPRRSWARARSTTGRTCR